MLKKSGTLHNYRAILISLAITLTIWLGSKWYYHDWFDDPFKYPAKAASLTAVILMFWSILLSTRIRLVEDHFGGLDNVYQVHKSLGKWAFYVIIVHPVCLAAHKLPDVSDFLQRLWFLRTGGFRYWVGHNLGVATFLLMFGLIAVTLWIKIPYHIWKRTHEFFGLVLLAVIIHVYVVERDIAAYPLLGLWMYGILGIAAVSYVYIRFLYRFLGPRYRYRVEEIERGDEILEITLAPEGEKMDFKPSQFVYLVIHKQGITPEPHPYSIASGYNLKSRFKLGIKKTGDHTRSLDLLEKDDPVTVYGPYGHFSKRFLAAERDCVFVGGGIGITPFIGMWHVALHSEERLSEDEVSQKLETLHPEVMQSWESPLVALFYVCVTEDQASFDKNIRNEVILSHFQGFKAFEERGHHYELYIDSRQGLITADYINGRVQGELKQRNIFLCGPAPMVDALTGQFDAMGIPREQIITEDFNLI